MLAHRTGQFQSKFLHYFKAKYPKLICQTTLWNAYLFLSLPNLWLQALKKYYAIWHNKRHTHPISIHTTDIQGGSKQTSTLSNWLKLNQFSEPFHWLNKYTFATTGRASPSCQLSSNEVEFNSCSSHVATAKHRTKTAVNINNNYHYKHVQIRCM